MSIIVLIVLVPLLNPKTRSVFQAEPSAGGRAVLAPHVATPALSRFETCARPMSFVQKCGLVPGVYGAMMGAQRKPET
jgi:hypothetical protein